MLDRNLLKTLEDKSSSREQAFEIFAEQDFPRFKRLNIRNSSFNERKEFKNISSKNLDQNGISLTIDDLAKYEDLVAEKKYGVSKKHTSLTDAFYNTLNHIEVAKNTEVVEPIYLGMSLDEDNTTLFDKTVLVVGESSSVTLAINYSGEVGEHNGNIQIFAGDNSNVNVLIVQNYSSDVRHYHNAISLIGRDASVMFSRIDIGAKEVVTDYSSYMEGVAGESNVESIYFGDGDSKLDISYNTYHNAMATQSEISVNGALKDSAKKVFRGSLFFARDARKSEGREEEFAILLDKTVKAHSIPALLCDEDDVIGEHAASAGQIDENKLFYLMSRGLSEEDAKKTIILASYEKALDCIPNEKIREGVKEIIGKKMDFS